MIPLSVLVVPRIAAPLHSIATSELPYLRGLTLAHPIMKEDSHFDISMLIGVDYYWKIVEDHIVRGDGPIAVQSKLGYLLSRPLTLSSSSCYSTVTSMHIGIHNDPGNDQTLARFWEIESSGTLPQEKTTDQFTNTYLKSITRQDDGSYVAKFPWKEDHAPLPSNYQVTKRRTRSLVKRLSDTPDLMKIYNQIIKEQETRNRRFIEKVVEKSPLNNYQTHYLPHHYVKKDSSTTPIHIVYDCSCRISNDYPSLNDCLDVGCPLVNDLCSIIIRFRTHKYGLSTDIEKAFLHVQLHNDDHDYTRFLWLSNPDDPESEFEMYHFKVVPFGATSSPFMLNATLQLHLRNHNSDVSKDIEKNLYVDNIVSGCLSEDDAIRYFKEARAMMLEANFNLRSWASNSPQLQTVVQEEKIADSNKMVNILGLYGDVSTHTDRIHFSPRSIDSTSDSDVTKRKVLQQSSRIFHPLGFLSPITIRAKFLMQELWVNKISWDEPLEDSTKAKWSEIVDSLQKAIHVSIPRQYFPSGDKSDKTREIHTFADVSLKAYEAVVYIQRGDCITFLLLLIL